MGPNELNRSGISFVSYEEQMASIAESMGHTVTFERMPIKDTWIPSRIEMSQILDHIDKAIQDDKPVYIHCPALLNSLRILCTISMSCRV